MGIGRPFAIFGGLGGGLGCLGFGSFKALAVRIADFLGGDVVGLIQAVREVYRHH